MEGVILSSRRPVTQMLRPIQFDRNVLFRPPWIDGAGECGQHLLAPDADLHHPHLRRGDDAVVLADSEADHVGVVGVHDGAVQMRPTGWPAGPGTPRPPRSPGVQHVVLHPRRRSPGSGSTWSP